MSEQNKQGCLVVVAGGDGAGKTSVLNKLRESHTGYVYTREPGGTSYGDDLRAVIFKHGDASPDAQLLTFFAGRIEHILKFILPQIQAGKIVVCDRFAESTYAYQVMENPELEGLFWDLMRQLVFPKLGTRVRYLFLDVDPKVGMKRVQERGGEITHFDKKPLSYHEGVRQSIKKFLDKMYEQTGRNVAYIIDANQSEDRVFTEVLAYLEQLDY